MAMKRWYSNKKELEWLCCSYIYLANSNPLVMTSKEFFYFVAISESYLHYKKTYGDKSLLCSYCWTVYSRTAFSLGLYMTSSEVAALVES
jgi:hypothetical protein